jgi:hypothetical protein
VFSPAEPKSKVQFVVQNRSDKRDFQMLTKGARTRQVIEKIGGASRDRTDDLIVANDGIAQINSFACSRLDAEYGPLRSNSHKHFRLAGRVCLTVFPAWASVRGVGCAADAVPVRAQMMLERAANRGRLLQFRSIGITAS